VVQAELPIDVVYGKAGGQMAGVGETGEVSGKDVVREDAGVGGGVGAVGAAGNRDDGDELDLLATEVARIAVSAACASDLVAYVLRYLQNENNIPPPPDSICDNKALCMGFLKFLTDCPNASKEDCIYAAYMMLLIFETSKTVSLIFI
jgi:hypothetical protein